MKVHELARDLVASSKEIVDIVRKLGGDVRNHMSDIDEALIDKIKAEYAKQQEDRKAQLAAKRRPRLPFSVVAPAEADKTKKAEVAGKPIPTRSRKAQEQEKEKEKEKDSPAPRVKRAPEVRPERAAAPTDRPAPVSRPDGPGRPVAAIPGANPTGESRGRRETRAEHPAQRAPRPQERRPAQGRPPARGERRASVSHTPDESTPVPERRNWDKNQDRRGRQRGRRDDREPGIPARGKNRGGRDRRQRREERPGTLPPKEKKTIILRGPISVKDLADQMAIKASELLRKLIALGIMVNVNQAIDVETATIVCGELGYPVDDKATAEEELITDPELQDENEPAELLEERPAVVTVMGHVDHGKTSLLDAIRETKVTATEAGGITQHIGAYTVDWHGRKIVFLDTPGHEAFTAMRARGAQVTDIAILVVAADDGVMPQTVEAINHAKAANVPIIVAINKIDKPGADPQRVKTELTKHNLVAEDWGGDTICVNVSALAKTGIEDLLEMILLVADMQELRANPNKPARGTVVEAKLDKGRGPVATILVQTGTLRIGDAVVCGLTYGRVRAMLDDRGRRVKKAGPSTPVEVVGLSDIPAAGDLLFAVEDDKKAREIAGKRQARQREQEIGGQAKMSLDDLFSQMKQGEVKDLKLVVKADVQGSVEAVKGSLEKLEVPEVRVSVIHEGVGAINESDVMLASASDAIIIGFNVRPDSNARQAAEREKVDVRTYSIIYDAIDDIMAAVSGLRAPTYREVTVGRIEIRETFKVPKVGTIAGCFVLEGKVNRGAKVRLVRDGIVVYEGAIDSLKRFKDDVREVSAGYECGIGLERYNDIKIGDIIEVYAMEEVPR
ncbi:MAG: translation initiation factor IF-2 [Bacillota bacterium]